MIFRRTKTLVILVVCAGSLLTLALSASLSRSLIENWQLSLSRDADTVTAVLEGEVEKFLFGLEGARGILVADDFKLDIERFRSYAASRGYFSHFPGALGFGFIRLVPREHLARYLKGVRRQFPDFEVHPKTTADPHMIIEFIEPLAANRPAMGLDIAFEAHRREAAMESARTGLPTLTKKISLVQAAAEHHGFLYFLPVYRTATIPATEEERLKLLVGWVYAPFVLDKLFATARARFPSDLKVEIRSQRDQVDLAMGDDIRRINWPSNSVHRDLRVSGRSWDLTVTAGQTGLIHSLLEVALVSFFGILLMIFAGVALYTGIRQKDRSLLAQKTWLDAVINSVSHSVIAVRPDGIITTFNQAAQKMLGYTPDEIVGRSTPEVIHDPEEVRARAEVLERELGQTVRPGVETFVIKALSAGSDTNEWTYIRKNGDRFPVRLTVSVVKDSAGGTIGYVGVAEDLTEQRKILRTMETQRLRMIESSKLSLLGEMAGGIAHEINSPLTVIIGHVEALAEGVGSGRYSPPVEKPAQAILNTAWRIAKIVKALRQFSRDAAHDPMTDVHLKTMVESTVDLCREKIERAGIQLKLDLDPSLRILGREVELAQVLMNLVSNSMDAVHGQDQPWIEIRAFATPHGRAKLTVTDSGSGIPKTVASKIMLPFFTTKDIGKGTGLGLSISKSIIESHYGVLLYDDSSPNTRFVIELPMSV